MSTEYKKDQHIGRIEYMEGEEGLSQIDGVRGTLASKFERVVWSGCKEQSQDKLPPKPRKKYTQDAMDSSQYMLSRDAPQECC